MNISSFCSFSTLVALSVVFIMLENYGLKANSFVSVS